MFNTLSNCQTIFLILSSKKVGNSRRENKRWAYGICSTKKQGSAKNINAGGITKGPEPNLK